VRARSTTSVTAAHRSGRADHRREGKGSREDASVHLRLQEQRQVPPRAAARRRAARPARSASGDARAAEAPRCSRSSPPSRRACGSSRASGAEEDRVREGAEPRREGRRRAVRPRHRAGSGSSPESPGGFGLPCMAKR
jgi:hypothetical protein